MSVNGEYEDELSQHGSKTSSQHDEMERQKEIEVLLSEMETRLRRSVLKVVRPTLDQVADISAKTASMQRKVDRHDAMLNHSETLEVEVNKLTEVMGVVRAQMASFESQTENFEAKAASDLADISHRADSNCQRVGDAESQLRQVARDFARVWEETKRLQEQHEDSAKNIWAGLASSLKKTENVREEVLERITQGNKLHYDLLEDLWGEGKGLNQVHANIQQLEVSVAPIPALEVRIDDQLARAHIIEDGLAATNKICEATVSQFSELRSSVDNRLTEYDNNNQVVMNKLTAYHASVLKNVRTEFREEIEASKHLRDEIGMFETDTTQFCEELSASLSQEIRRVDSLHKELVLDISEVELRRNKDRVHLDRDLQRLEADTRMAQETAHGTTSGLEYLSKVMALVLESEKMSSALQIQDFADKCCECWLGVPSDVKNRKAAAAHTAQSLEKLQPSYENFGRDFSANDMQSLVPMDGKMGLAKLEYLPGAISYEGKHFDRKRFLLQHHRMVTEAARASKAFTRGAKQGSFSHSHPSKHRSSGPPRVLHHHNEGEEHPDVAQLTLQPGANGGQGGSEVPGPPKNSDYSPRKNGGYGSQALEDPKPEHSKPGSKESAMASSSGFGQRPGSRHQPQAMGSKGFEQTLGPPPAPSPPPEYGSHEVHEPGAPLPEPLPADNHAPHHPGVTLPNIHATGQMGLSMESLRLTSKGRAKPVDAALSPHPHTAR